MDIEYVKGLINKIFLCDSPTGYSHKIDKIILDELAHLGYSAHLTNKGNVELFVEGRDHSKTVATSAHVDTLGLMVRSINANGTLNITNVGGPSYPTLDGEYCKILTRDDKTYTGTILCKAESVHVFEDARSAKRDLDTMIVRIDEVVKSKEDVLKLGIQNGDYIAYDPKTQLTESGFLKSRFIDDKGSVIGILGILKEMKDKCVLPKYDTYVYFVNQEEVGHGAATVSTKISEFVTVDMGCVGKDLDGNEFAVSICAKDSGGPYDYELTTRLINIAKSKNLNYTVDIFPYYVSDIGAAWRAGVDCKGALIGQGVASSHGMERTHLDGIINTMELLYAYLTE